MSMEQRVAKAQIQLISLRLYSSPVSHISDHFQGELLKDKGISNINNPAYSQPLCTALQIALVDLLRSFNICPSTVVGHSSGEIAAA